MAESIRNGSQGLGLNSSPGVEGYYTKLFGPSPCKAFDGKRDYFELPGPDRLNFLRLQYQGYQNLKSR